MCSYKIIKQFVLYYNLICVHVVYLCSGHTVYRVDSNVEHFMGRLKVWLRNLCRASEDWTTMTCGLLSFLPTSERQPNFRIYSSSSLRPRNTSSVLFTVSTQCWTHPTGIQLKTYKGQTETSFGAKVGISTESSFPRKL